MFTVATANVNGIRAAARRDNLAWLAQCGADVICLQEVRASDEVLAKTLADCGLGHWNVVHAEASAAGRFPHSAKYKKAKNPIMYIDSGWYSYMKVL